MDNRHYLQDESDGLFQEYSRIDRVKKYIDENIATDLRASVVAKKFELSISTLQHLFRKNHSRSYHQYLEDKRMELAFHLITKEGKRSSEAMYASGYNHRSTFHAAFKKKFKYCPGHFRK